MLVDRFVQEPDGFLTVRSPGTEDNEEPPDELAGEDLEYVLKLNVAMGRCATLLMDHEKSTASFKAKAKNPNSST